MNLTPSQYCIDFTDADTDQGDTFYNDLSAIADSVFTLADLDDLPRSVFALVGDDHIARLTEQARQAAEAYPVAPCFCPDCGAITGTSFCPVTGKRSWLCADKSSGCPNAEKATTL